MPNQKPTTYLSWVADPASNNLVQPPQSVSSVGFQPGQPVPAQWFNFCLHNLSAWTQYLDEANASTVLATSLNHSMRLLGGGTFSFDVASRTLAWSAPLTFAVPSSQDSANVLAAGSVMLPSGYVAYCNVNLPFSTTGDVTSGSSQVQNLGYEAGITVGMTVTGNGIPQGTTVTGIDGNTCTLSAASTATGAQTSLTFSASGPLTVSVAQSSTLVPGPNTVILARALDNVCSVGVGTSEMWLRDQERRSLVSLGYVSTLNVQAGENIMAGQPVYLSSGTPDGRTAGAAYLADAGSTNGPMRGQAAGFAHTAASAGSTVRIVQTGQLSTYKGLQIGALYYLDPTAPGYITAVAPISANVTIAPVGIAVDASTLLVQIGAARPLTTVFPAITVQGTATTQSIVNAAGIKTVLAMGAYWDTNQGKSGQSSTFKQCIMDGASGGLGTIERAVTMEFAGSVMAISGTVYQSIAGSVTLYVFALPPGATTRRLVAQSDPINNSAGGYSIGGKAFQKGAYTFAVGEQIFVQASFNTAAGASTQGANVQAQCDVTVELNS